MKIVRRSNHDHEDWRGNEWFVAQRLSERMANRIAEILNKDEGEDGDDFHVVVADDYVLPPEWEP